MASRRKRHRHGDTGRILYVADALERRTLLAAVSWSGGGDGVNWTDARNWSGGLLPGAADDVTINGAAGVTLSNGTQSVHSVVSGSPLTLAGGTLAVATSLQLNSATARITGGTLLGGTITCGKIVITQAGGTLDGVTIGSAGQIDASADWDDRVTVVDGLTMNGTVQLGGTGWTFGTLLFQGTQSLAGTGTITFGSYATNAISAEGDGGVNPATLTIGSGITIQGAYGTISGVNASDSVICQGLVSASSEGGRITLGHGAATGASTTLRAVSTSTVAIAGSLVSQSVGASPLVVSGRLLLNGDGTAGSPQLLEAMSTDLGSNSSAFSASSLYGTLGLANNTYVKLVDQSDNIAGSGTEAVYADLLVVPWGATLDLGGVHLYAKRTEIAGSVFNGAVALLPATNVFTPGKLGNAIHFNAISGSHVDVDLGSPADGHLDLQTDVTIETWVKFDALPTDTMAIFASKTPAYNAPGWFFGYGSRFLVTNAVLFAIRIPGDTNAGWAQAYPWTPETDRWYHLAVVKTGHTYTFYRDGVVDGSGTIAADVPVQSGSLALGRLDAGFALQGELDDFRIWDSARSATQIQNFAGSELLGNESGLIGYWRMNETGGTSVADSSYGRTTGTVRGLQGLSPPVLNSLPGASATLYLNFAGDYVADWHNGGTPYYPGAVPAYDIDNNYSTFSASELELIREIWSIVAEKYSPFNINVTTVDPGDYPPGGAARADIGGDGTWTGVLGVGGGYGQPGFGSGIEAVHVLFLFAQGDLATDQIGATIAHEAGHEFSLGHQNVFDSNGNLTGQSPGDLQRSPIMHGDFAATRMIWWYGSTSSPTTMQDDLAILSGPINKFGYRPDDVGDATATACLLVLNGKAISASGVIGQVSDVDYYVLTLGAGPLSLCVARATYGGMLDATLALYDSAGSLITKQDTSSLDETITTTVAAGTYYVAVGSHGSYGDIGQYTLTGKGVPPNNDAPTDLTLSTTSIAEGQPIGTAIGTFTTVDPDSGDSFTYTLVSGTGGTDNASFTISGNQLKSAGVFSYAAKSSYSIRVRTTDSGGLTLEKVLVISVTPVNHAPTDLRLSNTVVADGQLAGTLVGTFSSVDPDSGESFTYSLVSGSGSTDNVYFTISGSQLKIASTANYDIKNSYSIRVRTTDAGGLAFEKVFTIAVSSPGNRAPTDIALSTTYIAENQPIGTVVGSFTTVDPDAGDSFFYTLVSGTGSTDNASFIISSGQLKAAAVFSYATRSSYSIRVRTTDAGMATFEKVFAITVAPPNNHAPTDITLPGNSIAENLAVGTLVGTLSTTDVDAGDSFTYAFISGTGSTDNVSFLISGNQLKSNAYFNFETRNSYSIRVRTTDAGGLWYERSFAINVVDVAEPLVINGTAGNDVIAVTTNGATLVVTNNGVAKNYPLAMQSSITVNGLAGDDTVIFTGGMPGVTVFGGDGNDSIYGGSGNDYIDCGEGNDLVGAGPGRDTLIGAGGDDQLHGGKDNDCVDGGIGNDSLWGDMAEDVIYGRDGNDVVFRGNGNDTIWGGAGDDDIRAGLGNDVVYGEAGRDTLWGDGGSNTLDGGDDNDVIYSRNSLADTVIGGAGSDQAQIDSLLDARPLADVETLLA